MMVLCYVNDTNDTDWYSIIQHIYIPGISGIKILFYFDHFWPVPSPQFPAPLRRSSLLASSLPRERQLRPCRSAWAEYPTHEWSWHIMAVDICWPSTMIETDNSWYVQVQSALLMNIPVVRLKQSMPVCPFSVMLAMDQGLKQTRTSLCRLGNCATYPFFYWR